MDGTSETRKPLAELSNKQSDNLAPTSSLSQKKIPRSLATIKKPSDPSGKRLEKQSRLPLPSTRRHTQAGFSSRKPTSVVPVPSRNAAKPKRSVPAGRLNQRVTRTPTEQPIGPANRRLTASMSFTHGSSTTRSGMGPGRKPSQEEVSRDRANGQYLQEISSKTDALLKKVESMSSDQDSSQASKTVASDEFRIIIEDMRNQIQSLQNDRDAKFMKLVEESFELKGKLMEATGKQTQSEFFVEQEKGKVVDLQKEVEELKANIETLELGKAKTLDGVQVAKGTLEALKKRLREAGDRQASLEEEKRKLLAEMAEQKRVQDSIEAEASSFASKMKELQRRLELSETECASRESDVRRIRREKESAEAERHEFEIALKKKTASLQEERAKYEQLTTDADSLRTSRDFERKAADEKLNSFRTDVTSRLQTLESELKESKSNRARYLSELENRKQELLHLREALGLQESNLSRYNCEKLSLEAKLESLHGEVALKSQELAKLTDETKQQQETIANMEQQAREDAAMRRKLHNAIQELKGNIRVFCRVRPLLTRELESPLAPVARQMFEYNEKGRGMVARPPYQESKSNVPPYPFKFDRVFGPQCDQATVFEEISQLVQSALDGYRVCIFAYGQTGSGKTHTMLGQRGSGDVQLGMVPRSVRQVFETAKQLEQDQWTFKLKASFLEIYNETVRDLLVDSNANHKTKGKDDRYKIVFNSETKLSSVVDLTVVDVENEEQVQRLVDRSMRNRATAATKANERSSRSHSVFRLYIEGRNASTGQKLNGLLNLVDLAGSERLNQSKAEGDRLRETKNINKSLSSLGDVIAALSNKDKHIPFRNSKLTYLLQDSLGGDCKTLMFVNISHASESFNESLCSLRFAAKVNSCQVGTARRSANIEF